MIPPSRAGTARTTPAWRDLLLALFAYTVITIVLFRPVVLHIANCFPSDLGDPPNESWLIAWTVHALTTAPSQLLQGNIYYPHANALIYNDSLIGLLPLSTPFYLLSGDNAAFTYNVLFLLSFVMCAIFAFQLARRLSGSVPGAFLAGIVVAFCPYRMAHLGHLNQLSGQWLLLVLLFWERARAAALPDSRTRMWPELAALVVFYALQALSSLYLAAFLAVCLAIYLIVYIWQAGWQRARRFTIGVVVAAAALLGVLMPVLLPYLRLQGRVDTVRGRDQVIYFAADLRDFLRMPPFSVLYGWSERALGVPSHDSVQYLFPGLVALALACIGWSRRRAIPEIRTYGIILAVTAILALGLQLKISDRLYRVPLPYALLYDHISLFHSFRDPARFFFFGYICLAMLAAWGMARLSHRLRSWHPHKRHALLALLCAAALAEYWITPIHAPIVATGNAVPQVYHWLKAQPKNTPVLELPIGQQNIPLWDAQAMMTYYATYHWQPIVNGLGGYTPSGFDGDAVTLNRWPDAAASHLLIEWGVKYVIWHPEWTGKPQPNAAHLPLVKRFADGIQVYAVTPIG